MIATKGFSLNKTVKVACFILIASILFLSCVKDKPNDEKDGFSGTSGRKVWIANEGSLGNGNSSLSLYDIDHDSMFNNVFETKNGQQLGDVFQSILSVGDQLFLVINNSDKILVINKDDVALIASIATRKPRQMLLVNENKMYVSSLFYPEINIINPKTFQNIGKIVVDFPNTEGMLLHNGKVYAANWDTACNYIYEINPETDEITHRIPIAGSAPTDILRDKDKNLWVLSGNVYKGKNAALTQINPQNRSIIKSFQFQNEADIIKPTWNPTKDTLYFLGVNYDGGTNYNGLYRMDISASTLPSQLFIAAKPLQYFWGLGVDSATNQIYLADPKGFIQSGSVRIFNPDGNLLKEFKTGLGPGYFLFE